LPTEAEWEYASKGGENKKYGDICTDDNEETGLHSVCSKTRNGFGLCDMLGNVNEWVWDRYGQYGANSVTDPRGPQKGEERVERGTLWIDGSVCRAPWLRVFHHPKAPVSFPGFRLVRSRK